MWETSQASPSQMSFCPLYVCSSHGMVLRTSKGLKKKWDGESDYHHSYFMQITFNLHVLGKWRLAWICGGIWADSSLTKCVFFSLSSRKQNRLSEGNGGSKADLWRRADLAVSFDMGKKLEKVGFSVLRLRKEAEIWAHLSDEVWS